LFILVLNTIAAGGASASSSASVGGEVGIERSVVALLLTFHNAITTNGGHLKELDVSSVSWLEALPLSDQVGEGELSQLGSCD